VNDLSEEFIKMRDSYGRYLGVVLVVLIVCLGLTLGGCFPKQPVLSPTEQMTLWEKEGTVFRTGIMTTGGPLGAGRITFAVSPDGTRILFSPDKFEEEGFWLLDLKSGDLSKAPGEVGRHWSVPHWSRKGKQVLAVSTPYQNNINPRLEREIILLNSADWNYRKLAIPRGGNNCPTFSADGKFVFFIKGTIHKSLKSNRVRSLYDLYAYDLASEEERRLTHEEASGGINEGYDGGQEIFFSGKWLKRLIPMRSDSKDQANIYALNKRSLSLREVEVDQGDGFFDLILGGLDKSGNIYFKTSLKRPGGGNFIGTVYRCDAKGRYCARLTGEIYFFSNVKIAYETGEVFVDDRLGKEIVFRRLSQTFMEQ